MLAAKLLYHLRKLLRVVEYRVALPQPELALLDGEKLLALYYALLGRRRTVAPLEIKLEEYRQSAEQTSGLTP